MSEREERCMICGRQRELCIRLADDMRVAGAFVGGRINDFYRRVMFSAPWRVDDSSVAS